MKLAEFFVSLVVDSDQKSLDSFNDGISELDKGLRALKFAGIAFAITKFTQATVNSAVALQNFRNQTGLFVGDLQKWQVASELSDITMSAESVAQSIAGLQNNLTQIRLGGGNVSPFQLLGVDVAGKDAFQVLSDLRGAISGLDNATATNLIAQTGLSTQFINILRLSRQEFDKLVEAKTFLSPEKQKDVVAMGTAFTNLKINLSQLKDLLVASVSPFLTMFADLLSRVSNNVSTLIDRIPNLSDWVTKFGTAISAVLVILSPFIRMLTIAVAIVDDFVTFLNDGDSVIGRWIKNVTALGSAIKEALVTPLRETEAYFDGIAERFKNGFNIFSGGAEGQDGFFDNLGTRMGNMMNNVTNSFQNTFNITSDADPKTLSENIGKVQQRNLNFALAEINNGVAN